MTTRPKKLTLPADATVASVLAGLDDPEEYVRFVRECLGKCKAADVVRLRVVGSTRAPDFMLEEEYLAENARQTVPLQWWSGRRKIEIDPDGAMSEENYLEGWSDADMPRKQIEALLGEIRGWGENRRP